MIKIKSLLFLSQCSAQCSEFHENDELYGDYVWPGDTNPEMVVFQPCVHECEHFVGVSASRTCLGTGAWSNTDFSNCPTERTCQFVNLNQVNIMIHIFMHSVTKLNVLEFYISQYCQRVSESIREHC